MSRIGDQTTYVWVIRLKWKWASPHFLYCCLDGAGGGVDEEYTSEIFSTGMFAFIIMMPTTATPITHTHASYVDTRRWKGWRQTKNTNQQQNNTGLYISGFSIYNPRVVYWSKSCSVHSISDEWMDNFFSSVVRAFVSSILLIIMIRIHISRTNTHI